MTIQTFEDFQATRRWSDDLTKHTDLYIGGPVPGQLYAGDLCIEAADSIEGATGPYLLTIGNHQKFGELEELERDLYDFACSEELI